MIKIKINVNENNREASNNYAEAGPDLRIPDREVGEQIPHSSGYRGTPQSHSQRPEAASPQTIELDLDEDLLYEKKDRCYHLAKQKYDVFPSAYASGFIVRCRKGKVGKKKKKTNEDIEINLDLLEEGTFDKEKSKSLHGWFERQGGKGKGGGWVDCNTCRTNPKTGKKTCKTCGRQAGEKRSKYPACRPTPSACTKTGTSRKKSSMRVSWKKKDK